MPYKAFQDLGKPLEGAFGTMATPSQGAPDQLPRGHMLTNCFQGEQMVHMLTFSTVLGVEEYKLESPTQIVIIVICTLTAFFWGKNAAKSARVHSTLNWSREGTL